MRYAITVLIGLCGLSTALHAVEPHKRKPGQWQVTVTSSDPRLPKRVQQICLDAETDALLYKLGLGASAQLCSKSEIKNEGATVVNDSVCSLAGTKMTIHGETVFTGDTQYRETVRTHYEPTKFGKSEVVSTNEGKWVGACPADMKPGDVVVPPSPAMPSGMRLNLKESMSSINPQPLPPKSSWSSLNPQPLPPKPAPWKMKPPPEPPQASQSAQQ